MSGLFSIFSIGVRGMNVQQSALEVNSHNISNANTPGYSRQRAVIETTTPYGMPSMNSESGPGQFGTGAQVTTVQRIRNEFLDYQYRTQSSINEASSTKDNYLSQIEGILNEVSGTGLSKTIDDFFNSWTELAKTNPDSMDERTVVTTQAKNMTDEINQKYNELQDIKKSAQSQIQSAVTTINSTISKINNLNQQITAVKAAGEEPNDLMDTRDGLLDELSKYFNIKVDDQQFEGINVTSQDPTDPAARAALGNSNMIQSINPGQTRTLSYITSIVKDPSDVSGKTYIINYAELGDTVSAGKAKSMKVTPITAAQCQQLEENRVMWADNSGQAIKKGGTTIADGDTVNFSDIEMFSSSQGQLAGYVSVQNDVDNYIEDLNKMAKAIALGVNAIESGRKNDPTNVATLDKCPLFVNSSTVTQTPADEAGINAGNITINPDIIAHNDKLKTRTHDDQYDYESANTQDDSKDGTRATAIFNLKNSLLNIADISDNMTRVDFLNDNPFSGADNMKIASATSGSTIDDYYKNIGDSIGTKESEAKGVAKTQQSLLDSFDQSREAVSGVSEDEEVANLVQFSHAYQANAKVISTISELLDVVINGLIK